ncbi:hypothetical protein [Psychromicrobium lacuslunae]|uniref:hypothetical protein n=1 Tax=Psychromicrobium lacuslunae TaxID=1618207 RepID=UPI00069625A7|nr:hypothetical protein [Psychromicrobium lacuslunae]
MTSPKQASRLILAAITGLMLLSSCASPAGNGGTGSPAPSNSTASSSSQPSSSQTTGAAETALVIDVKATPESASVQRTLSCQGAKAQAGSTVTDPDAACAALENAGPTIFQTDASPQSCTMQMGGPQTAKVSGTFKGNAVGKEFSQQNGCAIAEWKLLEPLFGVGADNSK